MKLAFIIFIVTVLTINIYSVNAQELNNDYTVKDITINGFPAKEIQLLKESSLDLKNLEVITNKIYGDANIKFYKEDNKIYEVFTGCNKIVEIDKDVYGCKIFTDLYYNDLNLVGASWWDSDYYKRIEVNFSGVVSKDNFPIDYTYTNLTFDSVNELRVTCNDIVIPFSVLSYETGVGNGTATITNLVNLTANTNTTCHIYFNNTSPVPYLYETDLYISGSEPIVIENNYLNASFYNSTAEKYGLYQLGNKNGKSELFGSATDTWEYGTVGEGDTGVYGEIATNSDSDIMIYNDTVIKKIKESWSKSGNYIPDIQQYNTFYAYNDFFRQDINHRDSTTAYAFYSWLSQLHSDFSDNIVTNGSMVYLNYSTNYLGIYNHSSYSDIWTNGKLFSGSYRLFRFSSGNLPTDSTWRYILNSSFIVTDNLEEIYLLKELFDTPPTVYYGIEETYSPPDILFTVENLNPPNESSTYDRTPEFNYTVEGNVLEYNCTIYMVNSNGSIFDVCNNSIVYNDTNTNCTCLDTLEDDTYLWFVECQNDTVLNQSLNFTLTIETYVLSLNASLNYCQDDYNLIISSQYENCTYTDSEECLINTHRQIVFCPHGCIDNRTKYGADCYEPNWWWIIIISIIMIIAFGILYAHLK